MKKKPTLRRTSVKQRTHASETKASSERIEAEDTYRSLVDNSPLGIAILLDGKVVFCNRSLCTLSGYSREELLAMTAEQAAAVIHPEDRSRVLSVMQNRLDGKDLPPGQLLRSMKKTGEVQWVETLSRRTEFKGRPALEISYMDVTERIIAEEAYPFPRGKLDSRFRDHPGGQDRFLQRGPLADERIHKGRDLSTIS